MLYHLIKRKGIWYFDSKGPDGKRVRRTTKQTDKSRANQIALKFYSEFLDPLRPAQSHTLGDCIKHVEQEIRQSKRSAATIRFYLQKFEQIRRHFGDNYPLTKLTALEVDGYILARLRVVTAHTVHKELGTMRLMLTSCTRRGYYSTPLERVMPADFDKDYSPRERWVQQEDAWRLIDDLSVSCARYAAFVFASTARHAAVTRALATDYDGSKILVRDYKTKKAFRHVPVNRITKPFADRAFKGSSGLLYEGMTATAIRHGLTNACKRLGLPNLTPNDLRRSVAHWLRAAGVPLDQVADIFGHASTQMIERIYGVRDSDELAAAVNRSLGHKVPKTSTTKPPHDPLKTGP